MIPLQKHPAYYRHTVAFQACIIGDLGLECLGESGGGAVHLLPEELSVVTYKREPMIWAIKKMALHKRRKQ